MKNLGRCTRGATAVEFALVAIPVLFFIFGIMQSGYIVWVDNLLQTSVNVAARCRAIQSNTTPCAASDTTGSGAAAPVFHPIPGAAMPVWNNNTACGTGLVGLVGTYQVTIVWVVNFTLTARSCYPTVT
jgi:Flp pilus assembly protein TadG